MALASEVDCAVDVLVIGAGFGGCYALYRLRKLGFRAHIFEAGTSLGGVWHWNRYPGARVDSEVPYYQLSIPEVWRSWNWSQRFPGHEELRKYFQHVDKVLNLSKDITFSANVTSAVFDTTTARWKVQTSDGRVATATHLICATGSSFKKHSPDFKNVDSYKGGLYHASSWPEDLDTKGKRVAIIGSGATGVQCVQEVAKRASQLTVYVRTVAIAIPMRQRQLSAEEQNINKSIYKTIFNISRQSPAGYAYDNPSGVFSDATEQQREELFEELWNRGGFSFQVGNYRDYLVNRDTNRKLYDFWARKTRLRIKNPQKRDFLAPVEEPYIFGTKRSSLEQDYYECLDQDNVDIVDLKSNPIREFTERGIVCEDGQEREFDIVIVATGYDAMTGSLTSMGLTGKDGIDVKERWKDGVFTHLGLCISGCPNMFMVYGPQAPTAFTNAPTFLEVQIDFICDMLEKLRKEDIKTFEPLRSAEEEWKRANEEKNAKTLFPLTDSWYMGANIPGKKREQLNFIGGMNAYDQACRKALENWQGFEIVK